ncbi:hypothetical protein P8452_74696 [Trifolium repens]|nr:multiple RNA-binding domain-containing protein [Trifolium repens]WJX93132.1 hypothetical protein P8452_74696 [Trifolium repens]
MRHDTIVENVARKYGVSKSDLLDREADDLAVRIALGETQVISETKNAFRKAGVNLEALEELAKGKVDGLKRSNHVVFLEPAEAKAAFRGLAYKRYKDAPLYLEWAPSNVLNPKSTSKDNEMNSRIGEKDVKRQILEQDIERISDVDIDLDRVENDTKVQKRVEKHKSSTKLLVKNVAFEATKKDLRQLFSPFGQIKHLKLPMKFGNYRGFAFVEYVTQQEAQNALTALSSTHLYGRLLNIERANEGDRSLEELRARTAAHFNEHSGYQCANNLSKKRKAISMLDEENMKFKRFD